MLAWKVWTYFHVACPPSERPEAENAVTSEGSGSTSMLITIGPGAPHALAEWRYTGGGYIVIVPSDVLTVPAKLENW